MKSNEKKVAYKAFGLKIVSVIPLPELPELPEITEEGDHTDIVIETADLSELWCQLISPPRKSIVKQDLYLFRISEVATFCIQRGKSIIVSPQKGADMDYVRMFILGTCMGALLMQRKILPLHGSAIDIDGKAYCFVGESGAGKSTLASAFLKKGYQLLSDDLIAVTLSDDNVPFVTPAYPQQKLWQESLTAFGMESNSYRPVFQRETKYAVPVPSNFSANPLPLAGVFELVITENKKAEIRYIDRLKRLQTFFMHTYRNFLIPPLGLMNWHFSTSAKIVHQIDNFQIRRPASGFTAHHLASLILNTLHKEV